MNLDVVKPIDVSQTHVAETRKYRITVILRWCMLAAAAIFFALHFLHLRADFPNNSPWVDWSKYTDEGWYGDAAIRHYLTGHWYWKGDFNPAVALPVWPAIEWIVFRFTGVSPSAARALTLCVFAVALFTFYRLIERHTRPRTHDGPPPLAAAMAVLLLCASPYFYVFERMAILEPLLVALTALAILAASHLQPISVRTLRSSGTGLPSQSGSELAEKNTEASRPATRPWLTFIGTLLPSLALGALLPAMVLTKTTAVFLVPAIAYMIWARAGYRIGKAVRFAVVPFLMAAALWMAYFALFVRPHYLEDYRYLFSANAYTGIELAPFETVILNTITDGIWMGRVLYPLFFVLLALALFWRPRLFSNPLVPTLLLWTGGYFAFLAYHNNLQPRYYLVVAAPITVLVALALDFLRQPPELAAGENRTSLIASGLTALAVLAIVLPDAIMQLDFVLHPEYTFEAAANGIKRVVLADKTHSHLVLSISGSDLTLMTGLPSIDDDFGTLDLDQRVKQYRPGWYAAWNELDDDKMDALTPLYHPVRVAEFPSMDDSDRNLLILYRLDPTTETPEVRKHKKVTPKPLRTKLGQQPSSNQLVH